MQLEVKDHQYAEALATWKRLEKAGIDKDLAARIKDQITQLQKIRTDDSVYSVSGHTQCAVNASRHCSGWSARTFRKTRNCTS